MLIPTGATSRPGACRFTTASPCPPPTIPPARMLLNEASTKGSHVFARPIFPSPVAARMERAALGHSPRLRTPPTKSRTAHARVGTGHRARTWNYPLNSHPSISNPVVLSLCATSRRTWPSTRPARAPAGAACVAIALAREPPGRERKQSCCNGTIRNSDGAISDQAACSSSS